MSYLVKICGLTSQEDIDCCLAAGADWLGFIFHPSSPRGVSPEQAAVFDSGPASRVGVFVGQEVAEIETIMKTARLDLAQLHGCQPEGTGLRLGLERTIRVLWPQRYASAGELGDDFTRYSREAAYFLLDGGQDGGGHGQALDLDFLKNIHIERPWLLAGGLNAAKAKAAAKLNLPNLAGFDFNSGLEMTPGQKNCMLVTSAVAAAKERTRW